MINLNSEFIQDVGNITDATLKWLYAELGIPSDALFGGASLVGRDHVRFDGDTYVPDPGGVNALIVPVGVRGPRNILWTCIDDLIAFRPGKPDQFALRLGSAVLLNAGAAERAAHYEEVLPVYETPLSWLQHGGHGVVVLNWRACLPLHLCRVKTIACETHALGRRLDSSLREPYRGPDIRVLKSPEIAYAA